MSAFSGGFIEDHDTTKICSAVFPHCTPVLHKEFKSIHALNRPQGYKIYVYIY